MNTAFPVPNLEYVHGQLHWNHQALADVARKHGTPLYVYDATTLEQPLRELRRGLEGLRSQVCFAAKANSNRTLLARLGAWGAGADIVSGGELFRALAAGITADRIVFSGVGKTAFEMEQALGAGNSGVRSFNVESLSELELLNQVAGRLGTRARVALRFNPDVSAKTHPYISTGLRQNKFGLERREVIEAFRAHKRFKNCDMRGLSVHIGSQILTLSPLRDAFGRLVTLAAECERILGTPLEWLDLGGGVGVTYNRETPPTIAAYTALIQKTFGPKSSLKGRYALMLEPGRLIAARAGILLTQVLYKKPRGKKAFLVVDAAMSDLLRPSLYGSYHGIVPTRKSRGPLQSMDVVGPICESSDFFARNRKLAADISGGDFLAVLCTGAYGFSMASQYNSRPRPAEVLIENSEIHVIRKRESLEDLMRGE